MTTADTMLTWETRGHVAVVTLDQPQRRNVLSRSLVEQCLAALTESRATCRAVVITGAGDHFCAGADAAELTGTDGPPSLSETNPLDLFEAIDRDPRPVVAAVNGPALGGGVELTLPCDAVVAVPSATFCLPEVGLGVIPNTAMVLLPGIVGPRRALDLIHGRRPVDAQRAEAWGLVTEVAEGDVIDAAVAEARRRCEGAPPAALAATRQSVRRDPDDTWRSVRELMAEISWPEASEGMSAFVERRRPNYDPFWDS